MATETFREFMKKGWSWGSGSGGGISEAYFATIEDLRAMELDFPPFTEYTPEQIEEFKNIFDSYYAQGKYDLQPVKAGYLQNMKMYIQFAERPWNESYQNSFLDQCLGKTESLKALVYNEDGSVELKAAAKKLHEALCDFYKDVETMEPGTKDFEEVEPDTSMGHYPEIVEEGDTTIMNMWFDMTYENSDWWDFLSTVDSKFENLFFLGMGQYYIGYKTQADEPFVTSTYDSTNKTWPIVRNQSEAAKNVYDILDYNSPVCDMSKGVENLYDYKNTRPTDVGIKFNNKFNAIIEDDAGTDWHGYTATLAEGGLYVKEIDSTHRELGYHYRLVTDIKESIQDELMEDVVPLIDLSSVEVTETPTRVEISIGTDATAALQTIIDQKVSYQFVAPPDEFVTKWINDYLLNDTVAAYIRSALATAAGYAITSFELEPFTCETQSGTPAYYVAFTVAGESAYWDPSWLTQAEYDALRIDVGAINTAISSITPGEKTYIPICTYTGSGVSTWDTKCVNWFGPAAQDYLGKPTDVNSYIQDNELTLLGKNLYYGLIYIQNQVAEQYDLDYRIQAIVEPDEVYDRLTWTPGTSSTVIKMGVKVVSTSIFNKQVYGEWGEEYLGYPDHNWVEVMGNSAEDADYDAKTYLFDTYKIGLGHTYRLSLYTAPMTSPYKTLTLEFEEQQATGMDTFKWKATGTDDDGDVHLIISGNEYFDQELWIDPRWVMVLLAPKAYASTLWNAKLELIE